MLHTVSVIGKLHESVGSLIVARKSLPATWLEMIPANAKVLDVGCGDGAVGGVLLGKRQDLSIQGIDVLLRRDLHIPVVQYDGDVIPHPDRSFDTVIFIDVLHHTGDPLAVPQGGASGSCAKCIIVKDHNRDGLSDWTYPGVHGLDWQRTAWRQVDL